MTIVAFDTHKFIRRLRDAGISEPQAEAFTDAFRDVAAEAEVATKRDIERLEAKIDRDLAPLRADIGHLDGKIDRLEEKLDGKIDRLEEKLDGKIDRLEERLDGKIDRLEEKLGGKLDRLDVRLTGDIQLLKWMMTFVLGMLLAILFKLFA
jgi:chromosome segregation ATPase